MHRLKSLFARLFGYARWHVAAEDGRFVWRRYDTALGRWQIREMSEEEHEEALWYWAIK